MTSVAHDHRAAPALTCADLEAAADRTAALQAAHADPVDIGAALEHELWLAEQFVAQHPDADAQLDQAARDAEADHDIARGLLDVPAPAPELELGL
jgi:hypothetical protein